MIENNYNLNGVLIIGQNKKIDANVQIHTSFITEDINDEDEPIHAEYLDGFKMIGELSFIDENPPLLTVSHLNANELILDVFYEDDKANTSRFKIFILNQTGSAECSQKGMRRYFWQFTNYGGPKFDGLNIFPQKYTGSSSKKTYVVKYVYDNIKIGYGVVIAENRFVAKKIVVSSLDPIKINQLTVEHETNHEGNVFISIPNGVYGNGN